MILIFHVFKYYISMFVAQSSGILTTYGTWVYARTSKFFLVRNEPLQNEFNRFFMSVYPSA